MRYAPQGFNEVQSDDPEATLGREMGDRCPRHVQGWQGSISGAARCYSCGHLFEPKRSKNDVLCPCCA